MGLKGFGQGGFYEIPLVKSDNAYGQPIESGDSNKGQVNVDRTFLDFNEAINISNGSLVSSPRLSVFKENVFVVWEEGKGGKSNIAYRHSNDSGITFRPAISISSSDTNVEGVANDAMQPDIVLLVITSTSFGSLNNPESSQNIATTAVQHLDLQLQLQKIIPMYLTGACCF